MNKTINLLSLICLGVYFSAQAQAGKKESRHDKVVIKPRPNYSPKGMTLGAFTVHTNLDLKSEYKDNIYSTSKQPKSDLIFHIDPNLVAQSNWNNHSLSFAANGDFWSYQQHSSEDQTNYSFSADGRLDVMRNSFAHASLSYSQQTMQRSDPDYSGSVPISPTPYTTMADTIGYEHKINRVRFNIDNDMQQLNYSNNMGMDGRFIHNTDMDRFKNDTALRVGYEITPRYEAFFRAAYSKIDYNESIDDYGFRRSSAGYNGRMGVALDITGKLTGDVYIGYQSRSFEDAGLKLISGNIFGVNMKWNPTGLTTVLPHIEKTIMDSAQSNAGGSLNTTFGVNVDHELYRHLILSASSSYGSNEYTGNNRTDTIISMGLGGKYFLTSNFYFKGGFNYIDRTSTVSNAGYQNNSFYLTFGGQL